MPEIKIGDVVLLRSGSVPMTVKEVRDSDAVCVWQKDGMAKEAIYPFAVLKMHSPPRQFRVTY